MISPEPLPPAPPALAWAETVTTDGRPAIATVVAWHIAGGDPAAESATESATGEPDDALPMSTPSPTPRISARTAATTVIGDRRIRCVRVACSPGGAEPGSVGSVVIGGGPRGARGGGAAWRRAGAGGRPPRPSGPPAR